MASKVQQERISDLTTLPLAKVRGETGRHLTKFQSGKFVAWDGEGITDANGDHHYFLLANSYGERIATDGTETLDSDDIFRFLLDSRQRSGRAINVIFSGVYDFNCFIRSLPEATLEKLHDRGRVYWGRWRIALRNRKRLTITDRESGASFTLWDIWGFFQSSFVAALEAWGVEVAPDVLDNIKAQKLNRSQFTVADMTEIERYCFQELDCLVSLMNEFRAALAEADIPVTRWDGPGAMAQTLYQRHRTKLDKCVPSDAVNMAAQYAYAGGRIELVRLGDHPGPVWIYDIRSAYPSAIAQLPSLAGAEWRFTTEADPPVVAMSLYHIRWNFGDTLVRDFYPLFYRTPQGGIHFPPGECTNWIWTPEYEMICDLHPGQFETLGSYQFTGDTTSRPFGWTADIYRTRQEWKQEDRAAEKALKLALNSLYGKMIQQVGWSPTRGIPPYHQLEWGGYVTSTTRAAMYRAAYGSPDIIGFETDGIISRAPLDVPLGDGLGEWEEKKYLGITYAQNGVYWLEDRDGWAPKFRGFDRDSLHRDDVLDAWDDGSGVVTAQMTRFQGLGYSLQFPRRMENWCKWITTERVLDVGSGGSKRFVWPGQGSPADGLVDTGVYAACDDEHSTKYPLVWRDGVPDWRQELADALVDVDDELSCE